LPPGTYPAEDELLPALPVVLTVDHGKTQHGAPARQVQRLDVELVVALADAGQQVAQRVAALAYRRLLGHRYRLAALPGQQQLIGAVHVDAGQQHQLGVGQVGEHGRSVLARHRQRVDHRIGTQRANLVRQAGEVGTGGVQVGAAGELGRLVVAPVHDGDVVPAGHQVGRDTAADEPGTAQDENPHAVTVRAGHGGQEGASADSRAAGRHSRKQPRQGMPMRLPMGGAALAAVTLTAVSGRGRRRWRQRSSSGSASLKVKICGPICRFQPGGSGLGSVPIRLHCSSPGGLR
jgi:hypothetical protein